MSDEDFMNIIQNSGIKDLQLESEMFNLSISDFIRGLRSLAEASMLITDYIDAYVRSMEEDDDESDDDDSDDEEDTDEEEEDFGDDPMMTVEAVMFAKQLFEVADKFTYALLDDSRYGEERNVIEFLDEDDDDNDDD